MTYHAQPIIEDYSAAVEGWLDLKKLFGEATPFYMAEIKSVSQREVGGATELVLEALCPVKFDHVTEVPTDDRVLCEIAVINIGQFILNEDRNMIGRTIYRLAISPASHLGFWLVDIEGVGLIFECEKIVINRVVKGLAL